MANISKELADKVANVLVRKGVEYKENVVVGNSLFDFYFKPNQGTTAVFEVKPWEPTQANLDRARSMAAMFVNTSGSPNAFVVLPGEFNSDVNSSVVSITELPSLVDRLIKEKPKEIPSKQPQIRETTDEKYVFVALPFSYKYDDTFEIGIQQAATVNKIFAKRVDHEHFSGDSVDEIKDLIYNSVGVIADLTEIRPNVLYELGYAEGLGRKTIQICRTDVTPLKDLPFDVRNNFTVPYLEGGTTKLYKDLIPKIRAIFTSEQ